MGTARPGPGVEWWEKVFQTTIAAYPDRPQDGLAACERLLSRTDLPYPIEEATRKNATWYLPKLGEKREVWEIPQPVVPAGWARCNPSIAVAGGGGLAIIVRTVNYHIIDGRYQIADPDGVIRTENYLLSTDAGCVLQEAVRVDDSCVPRVPTQVMGLEDCRLFWCGGGWMISATSRDLDPDMVARMVVARLSDTGVLSEVRVLSDSRRHEKNWMPIQGTVHHPRWIYSVEPTIIKGDDGMGFIEDGPYLLRHARGGSQVIPLPERGHLALVHESVDFDGRRVYTHRFVFFDKHLSIDLWSYPFCFEGRGIEFAAGMVLVGEDLLISYGVHDAKAMLLRMPLSEALEMLGER